MLSSSVLHNIVLPKPSNVQNARRFINVLLTHLCTYFGSVGPCAREASILTLGSRLSGSLQCVELLTASSLELFINLISNAVQVADIHSLPPKKCAGGRICLLFLWIQTLYREVFTP